MRQLYCLISNPFTIRFKFLDFHGRLPRFLKHIKSFLNYFILKSFLQLFQQIRYISSRIKMSSIKRIKVPQEGGEDTISTRNVMKQIQDLPNDVFRYCLEFVGKGSFAFVAPVSKHFYWNYINLGVEMKNNVIDVDVILQQGCNKLTTTTSITTASGLRLATECFLHAPTSFQEEVCRQAAINGRLDVLKCAASIASDQLNSVFPDPDPYFNYNNHEQMQDVILETVANGHLDVVEFLYDHGVDLDNLTNPLENEFFFKEMRDKCKATSLHWMVSKGIISDWAKGYIAKDLVRDGEIGILKESYTEYINQDSLYACAEAGNFEIMNWLLQELDIDVELTFNLFSKAAKSGNIPIMELCLRNGCPTDESICSSAMQNKNGEAALTALKWLHEHDIPMDEGVCTYAARYGHLKVLRWARENGCPWDRETFNSAAKHGHIDILEYCFKNNCPMDSTLIYQMPFDDHLSEPTFSEMQERSLKVYKWLHQHSIPWDDTACLATAKAGHLATLKWAIENGCPWHEGVFEELRVNCINTVAMMKFCLQHLSSMDDSVYIFAINKMNGRWKYDQPAMIEVLQMFHDYGMPWNRDTVPCADRLGLKLVAGWLRCVGCPH